MIEKYLKEFEEKLLKIHYEPEHESGVTCWCKPKMSVKEGVPHIEHNEQRVVLKAFLRTSLQSVHDHAVGEGKQKIQELEAMGRLWRMAIEHLSYDERKSVLNVLEHLKTAK